MVPAREDAFIPGEAFEASFAVVPVHRIDLA
jgi:hypothetical protein